MSFSRKVVTPEGSLLLSFFFFSSRRRHTRYIGDWSSDVCSSDLVVVRIVARHDPPHDFVAGASDKKRGVAMLVERMFFPVEEFFAFDQERRHPRRIVRVNPPGKLEEGVPFLPRIHLGNFNRRHGISRASPSCGRLRSAER